MRSAGSFPEFVPEGHLVLERNGVFRTVDVATAVRLMKHTPGGHEHDQSSHGNWAGGGGGENRWSGATMLVQEEELSVEDRFGDYGFRDDMGMERSLDDPEIEWYETGGISFTEGDLPTSPEALELISHDSAVASYWAAFHGAENIRHAAADLTGGDAWEGMGDGGFVQPQIKAGWDSIGGVEVRSNSSYEDSQLAYAYLHGINRQSLMSGSAVWSMVSTEDLYRGVGNHTKQAEEFYRQATTFKPGDTLEFALAAFTPDLITASSFTETRGPTVLRLTPEAAAGGEVDGLRRDVDPVLDVPLYLKLERGAKVVVGSGDPQFEQVTGGRFEILKNEVTHRGFVDGLRGPRRTITIRQTSTFDPDTGELTKRSNYRIDAVLPGSVGSPFPHISKHGDHDQLSHGNWARKTYHLTFDPNFSPDPTKRGESNYIGLHYSDEPGLYTTDSPEHWLNAFGDDGYWRPFVAEIGVKSDTKYGSMTPASNKEEFIPASSFSDIEVLRVLPLDEYARETYGEAGWVESSLGDTDHSTKSWQEQNKALKGYRSDRDARSFTPSEVRSERKRFARFLMEAKGWTSEDVDRFIGPGLSKHYPGLHDQQSHGNWAIRAGHIWPTVSGEVNVDLIREADPVFAEKVDALMESAFGGYEAVSARYKALLLSAAERSEDKKRESKEWYTDAHKWATDIAATYVLNTEKFIGIVAALSPGAFWSANRSEAEAAAALWSQSGRFNTGEELAEAMRAGLDHTPVVGRSYDRFLKAVKIMNGESVNDVLTGPKERSFYNNLLALPGDRNVTIDTWMAQAAGGTDQSLKTPSKSRVGFTTQAYGASPGLGKVITDLASDPDVYAVWGSLLPRQVQSIIWGEIRGESG